MKSKSRRYEVLLPVRFNDGSDVPEELLGEAVNEVVEQFNAVTFYKETAEGRWRHGDSLRPFEEHFRVRFSMGHILTGNDGAEKALEAKYVQNRLNVQPVGR